MNETIGPPDPALAALGVDRPLAAEEQAAMAAQRDRLAPALLAASHDLFGIEPALHELWLRRGARPGTPDATGTPRR